MTRLKKSSTHSCKSYIFCAVLSLLFLLTLSGNCQTVESLEKEIKSIQKDIKLAEKLLKETSKNK